MIEDKEVGLSLKRHCRLRAMPHMKLENAVNSYMIGNKFGQIIGGNLMQYMFNNEQNRLCYPTLFKSRREIESFLSVAFNELKVIEKYCYDHNKGDYNV